MKILSKCKRFLLGAVVCAMLMSPLSVAASAIMPISAPIDSAQGAQNQWEEILQRIQGSPIEAVGILLQSLNTGRLEAMATNGEEQFGVSFHADASALDYAVGLFEGDYWQYFTLSPYIAQLQDLLLQGNFAPTTFASDFDIDSIENFDIGSLITLELTMALLLNLQFDATETFWHGHYMNRLAVSVNSTGLHSIIDAAYSALANALPFLDSPLINTIVEELLDEIYNSSLAHFEIAVYTSPAGRLNRLVATMSRQEQGRNQRSELMLVIDLGVSATCRWSVEASIDDRIGQDAVGVFWYVERDAHTSSDVIVLHSLSIPAHSQIMREDIQALKMHWCKNTGALELSNELESIFFELHIGDGEFTLGYTEEEFSIAVNVAANAPMPYAPYSIGTITAIFDYIFEERYLQLVNNYTTTIIREEFGADIDLIAPLLVGEGHILPELVGTWHWGEYHNWQYVFNADGTGMRGTADDIVNFTWAIHDTTYGFVLAVLVLNLIDGPAQFITEEMWAITMHADFLHLANMQVSNMHFSYIRSA